MQSRSGDGFVSATAVQDSTLKSLRERFSFAFLCETFAFFAVKKRVPNGP